MRLQIGHVYGNGNGLYRKIRRFTNTLGVETKEPYNVHYVRCSENGAVTTTAKEQVCWVSTFISWTKLDCGPLGNLATEAQHGKTPS